MKIRFNTTLIILLFIWLFATAVNINKAYHMDDTAHLQIAQWITQNPLHPMSGHGGWDKNSPLIHTLNQPPLYFYLMAAWSGLFGFDEVPMHIFQSFFTLTCIIFIYLIAKVIISSRALFLTTLIALSPAFIIGQNVMTDIPLLSFWLAFFYVLMRPDTKSETRRFALAGFLAGCACLVKYSSLSLIPVMLLYLVIRRQIRLIWTVGIPVLILILWSGFNYMDYGAIHILNRPVKPFIVRNAIGMGLSFLVCLGSILPYSPVFFHNLLKDKKKLNLIVLATVIIAFISAVVIIAVAYMGRIDESMTKNFFVLLFIGNGIAMATLLSGYLFVNSAILFTKERQPVLLLYLWLFFGAVFIILYAPFMATRHVLLVIVPVSILLTYYMGKRTSFAWDGSMLLLTVLLTLVLGISDINWANFYREKAALIRSELPGDANVLFTGAWGWSWYAAHHDMKVIEDVNPKLQEGDYVVSPQGMPQPSLDKIPSGLRLQEVKKYSAPHSLFTFFSTRGDFASFYLSSTRNPPWLVTRRPLPPIVVYQIE